ncbi:MAG TPA: alpha/beta family hydrolase [Candidatus Nanopelagicales bacterium]|nr:alpha/beta family hydrolase [Candidatus Nanopelagicales bacterium]
MESVVVPTPVGDARVHHVGAARPRALLVLGHGAGRGADTADLLGLARDLPAHRVAVALVDQPWVLAGRRVATAPPTLDRAWVAVLEGVRSLVGVPARVPMIVGGRSAGARVACRTAGEVAAAGVLLLAFPLVPPASRKDADKHRSALDKRRPELTGPSRLGLATVVLQGERDTFGTAAELREMLRRVRGAEVLGVPGADHSLRSSSADPAPVLLQGALRAVALARGE